MKSPIQLIEQIIRAKTALHLKLIADQNRGKADIGGESIENLVAEVDAGIFSYEQMLVRFKNEIAAEVMEAAETDPASHALNDDTASHSFGDTA
jgi:hypothetical protein